MSIEKRGVVDDANTPPESGWSKHARSRSEARRKAEQSGLDMALIDQLDDHLTKRAAERAAGALGKGSGS